MLKLPAVYLNNIFGASVQQLALAVETNRSTGSSNFYIQWIISYLSTQVDTCKFWNLQLKSDRERIKIINEGKIDELRLETPCNAFNYLLLLLEHLPSPLIPTIPENLVDLRHVAFPEGDIAFALKSLVLKVRGSDLSNQDKEFFERELEKSFVGKWTTTQSATMDLVFQATGEPNPTSMQRAFHKDSLTMRDIRYITAQLATSRQKEFEVNMKLCDIKVEALLAPNMKRYVNEYHYTQFSNTLNRLDTLFKNKRYENTINSLFDSRYLFAEVQQQLIAMQYHLDIFIHFVLKELNVDWSTDEKMKTTFDDAVAIYDIESQARRFWNDVFGADKVIANRKHFMKRFRERCAGASVLNSYDMDRLLKLLDPFCTDFVTLFTFADLMRSFGNNVSLIKEALYCPGFLGKLDKESSRLIEAQAPGTYLIRYDTTLVVNFISNYPRNMNDCDYQGITRQEIVVKPISFDDLPGQQASLRDECGEYSSLAHLIASHSAEWFAPFAALPIEETFWGDLHVSALPPLSVGQYITRFSSQPGYLTISWNDIKQSVFHIRFMLAGKKITTATKITYESFDRFLMKLGNLVPYPHIRKVYQTAFETNMSEMVEVSDPFTLEQLSRDKTTKRIRLSKIKKLILKLPYDTQTQLFKLPLQENYSLTILELHIDSQTWPLEALMHHQSIRELYVIRSSRSSVDEDSPQVAAFINLLPTLPNLEVLGCENWDHGLPSVLEATRTITTLKKLQLDIFIGDDRSFEVLESLYTTHPSLTALSLASFTRRTLNIGKWPNLKELTVLSPTDDIWDIQKRSDWFPNLEKLNVLFREPKKFERLYRHKDLEVKIGQFYSSTDFKLECPLHFSIDHPIWRQSQSTSMYLALEGEKFTGFKMDEEKIARIEHLRLRGCRDQQLFTDILGWFSNSTSLKSLAIDDCFLPYKFSEVLPQITSLRALSLVQVQTSDLVQIVSHPNLLWLNFNGEVPEENFRPLFQSNPLKVHSFPGHYADLSRTYKNYAALSYQRRLTLTSEIQDWIVIMINIVHCSSVFNKLPVEIWELIVSEFSFMKPFLDPISAFRMISGTNEKVIKVVDWHVVRRLIEENSWIYEEKKGAP